MYMHFLKIQISKKKGWIEEPWIEFIWSVAWKYCIVCLLLNTKRSKPSPIICNSLLTLFIKSFSPEKKINCYKTLDYHILTAPGLKCITVLHVGMYMYIVYIYRYSLVQIAWCDIIFPLNHMTGYIDNNLVKCHQWLNVHCYIDYYIDNLCNIWS